MEQTTLSTLTAFLANAPTNARDLLDRWTPAMETQVNVIPGTTRTEQGGWTDEFGNDWFNIRIPKQAASEPYFNDRPQHFSFAEKAEAIGCTGWDWQERLSRWVAFDFDAITGHAAGVGLSSEKLREVQDAACKIPWVQVRRSTSGNGLHLYVYLGQPVPTENHNEHAALARSILGMMSQETGFNFGSAVDCAGGNIWIWSRRATRENQGLSLVCESEPLDKVPHNWRLHLDVVTRRRSKVRVVTGDETEFEKLATARHTTPLDPDHHRLIDYLAETGFSTVWVQDYYLLQTHTAALKQAHEQLGLLGLYDTNSEGEDPGQPNCFAFAAPDGGWQVYRFSPGVAETPTWEQDGKNWTCCDFNMLPSLETLTRVYGGTESEKQGAYSFPSLEILKTALQHLGAVLQVPTGWGSRPAVLTIRQDGRLVVKTEQEHMSVEDALARGAIEIGDRGGVKGKRPVEDCPSGWSKSGRSWVCVLKTQTPVSNEAPLPYFDDKVRSLVAVDGENSAGWIINTSVGDWVRHPKDDAKSVLLASGFSRTEVDQAFGESVIGGWRLVNLPFRPEYPGNRQWNLNAPQFVYAPAETDKPYHPHWDLVLTHCGQGLDESLSENEWAKQNGIQTGAEYLKLWIACMLREPFEPLPYIFFFGDQNCGKSIFHEAIKLLVTRGIVPADRALTSKGDFNGELANAILCYVEETDLSSTGKSAYNKLKDWVTCRVLSIHAKRQQVYMQANTTHWVQMANQSSNCPVFENDTRITMIHVENLKAEIPKTILIKSLSDEGPHFMRSILDLHLPTSIGRLRVPVIETAEKRQAQVSNLSALDVFLREQTYHVPGEKIMLSVLYEKFLESLNPLEQTKWATSQRVSKGLPHHFPTGLSTANKTYVGNISFEPGEQGGVPLVRTSDGKLRSRDTHKSGVNYSCSI